MMSTGTNPQVMMMEEAVNAIVNAKELLIFTGAGMSVESGIAPFRGGDNGLWNGIWGKVVLLYGATPLGWRLTPSLTWSYFISEFYRPIIEAKPHKGYMAITKLQNWFLHKQQQKQQQEQQRKRQTSTTFHSTELRCVTMNVDGLHQMAGTRNVKELHGSVLKFICGTCGKEIQIPFNKATYTNDQQLGKGGWVRRGHGKERLSSSTTTTTTDTDNQNMGVVSSEYEHDDTYAFDFESNWNYVPSCREFGIGTADNSDNGSTCTDGICPGKARPDATLFGEALPYDAMRSVQKTIKNMKGPQSVCIVVGTSSVVYPAASIPEICAQQGSTIIEINPEEQTPLSNIATIRIQMQAGEALEAIVEQVLSTQ